MVIVAGFSLRGKSEPIHSQFSKIEITKLSENIIIDKFGKDFDNGFVNHSIYLKISTYVELNNPGRSRTLDYGCHYHSLHVSESTAPYLDYDSIVFQTGVCGSEQLKANKGLFHIYSTSIYIGLEIGNFTIKTSSGGHSFIDKSDELYLKVNSNSEFQFSTLFNGI